MRTINEKSCGAIIFKKFKKEWKVLLIKQINKNWGFPKGHVENGESEIQTAQREIWEEVQLDKIQFFIDYKYSNEYVLTNGNNKQVIYFLAQYSHNKQPKFQASELLKAKFISISRALNLIKFKTVREILNNAYKDFINLKSTNEVK